MISDMHAGRDGLTRVVTLRTAKGTFKRPVTKICLLPKVYVVLCCGQMHWHVMYCKLISYFVFFKNG